MRHLGGSSAWNRGPSLVNKGIYTRKEVAVAIPAVEYWL